MGDDDRRCVARARSTGERCGRKAMIGQTVCYQHGGNVKRNKAAAARRITEAKAAKLIERLDVTDAAPLGSPVDAIIRLGGQLEALKDQMWSKLAEIDVDTYDPRFMVMLSAVNKVVDQLSGLLVDINRLGLEERRVELDEQRARMAALVIEAVLGRRGVPVNETAVREEIAAEVIAVEARVFR